MPTIQILFNRINHFHFLVRIKTEAHLKSFIENWKVKSSRTLQGLAKHGAISKFLTQQFSHLFNSYTQAFNKENARKGALFMHPYKRKQITDEAYLIKLIHYIHHNPVEAGLCQAPSHWKYSSFNALTSTLNTLINRKETIALFDNLENFIYCHSLPAL